MIRENHASLTVQSEVLTVEQITKLLGLDPSRSHDAGETLKTGRVAERASWTLDAPDADPEDATGFGSLRALAGLLRDKSDALAQLREGGETTISWWGNSDSSQGGFVLPADLLAGLAPLGCDVFGTTYWGDEQWWEETIAAAAASSPRHMLELARRWWPSHGTDIAFDAVDRIVRHDVDAIPALIRALADTAPQGGLRYIGTAILEDLEFNDVIGTDHVKAMDAVAAAGLTPGELFEVLSGAYEFYLERWDIHQRFADVLSWEQRAWLLDRTAPNRWSEDPYAVARGTGIEFVSGPTEWSMRVRPD